MSEEKIITAEAAPIKTVASVELEAAVADELKLDDPSLDKAKALLGSDEELCE